MCYHFNKLWWLFSVCFVEIYASTHWVVTEGGLLQPKVESPFELAQPYDLLAFLNQDTRLQNIINMHHDLSQRQQIIQNQWGHLVKYSDTTAFMLENKHCLQVGHISLVDWYTSSLEEVKGKLDMEELIQEPAYDVTDIPDCKKISSLTFSMCAFEHLDTMKQRENLRIDPEVSVSESMLSKTAELDEMSIDHFGSWVAGVLRRNTSSWLHYNMASLFWRIRGKAPKALECSRRAVHYAPRNFKDIALLSMGIVSHRSKKPEDALIILGAAVDHDPDGEMNHFILANVYAVLGDFNNSIIHYEKCLQLNPQFSLGEKHKDGVICYDEVLKRMKKVQVILSKLRQELAEYKQIETNWLKSQAVLLKTMKQPEGYDYKDVKLNLNKMQELTNLNIKELKKDGEKFALIQHFLDGPSFNDEWFVEMGIHGIDSAYNLERLIKHIGRHADMSPDILGPIDMFKHLDIEILKEIGPTPTFTDIFPDNIKDFTNVDKDDKENKVSNKKQTHSAKNEKDISEYETGIILYPTTLKISRTTEDFDKDSDWPSKQLCKDMAFSIPADIKGIYQIFLPFENKGIRLKSLLTDKIGVPVNIEHEVPWHPPICPNNKEAAAFTQKKPPKPQFVMSVIPNEYLRHKLLEYVADGNMESAKTMQDAEIGQRIFAAMQMKLAPKWLLYTLASLYWRVRENNMNALHCIMTARRIVDAKYKDIVSVSLASVYLEMGYFDEALNAAEEAFKLSLYEPATNFILSELNMIKKHRNTQMFHLKQVIRVEPGFMGGIARSLLLGWSCMVRKVETLQELDFKDGDICTQVESGMSMVCEKDGTNCHLSSLQCYGPNDEIDISKYVRKQEPTKEVDETPEEDISANTFDLFFTNMPLERTDKSRHQENFSNMKTFVKKMLKGCGKKGCASNDLLCNTFCIHADDLAINEEDCTQQHHELGYWLHTLSFKDLLSDADPKFLLDILSMEPSYKKIPECTLPTNSDDDFFLEHMLKVDTKDWEPVLSLMTQLAELFDFYDYSTLGSKIAAYLETPRAKWGGVAVAAWWCGAAGRGGCAARCLAAAHAHRRSAARPLAALLHIQSKSQDAKEISYLSFYSQPRNNIDAFLVAVSHTYMDEFEQAVWMYRYALSFDDQFLPAKACLHATMCLMLFGDNSKKKY